VLAKQPLNISHMCNNARLMQHQCKRSASHHCGGKLHKGDGVDACQHELVRGVCKGWLLPTIVVGSSTRAMVLMLVSTNWCVVYAPRVGWLLQTVVICVCLCVKMAGGKHAAMVITMAASCQAGMDLVEK